MVLLWFCWNFERKLISGFQIWIQEWAIIDPPEEIFIVLFKFASLRTSCLLFVFINYWALDSLNTILDFSISYFWWFLLQVFWSSVITCIFIQNIFACWISTVIIVTYTSTSLPCLKICFVWYIYVMVPAFLWLIMYNSF